jgi:hypothetical protein
MGLKACLGGSDVLAPPFILKFMTVHTFWNVKHFQMKKSNVYIFTCYMCTESFNKKNDLSFGLCKKEKKLWGAKNKTFCEACFVYFYIDHKNIVLCEAVQMYIDCRDVVQIFLLEFF